METRGDPPKPAWRIRVMTAPDKDTGIVCEFDNRPGVPFYALSLPLGS